MSKASGAVLIAAGAGVAAYALAADNNGTAHIPAPIDLHAVTDAAKAPAAPPNTAASAPAPIRTATAPPIAKAAPATRQAPAPTVTPPAQPWRTATTVSVPPRGSAPALAPMGTAAPLPHNAVTLARALQQELQRVGCYDGKITGTWSPATQRAMRAFMTRVNAALPTDTPDVILLSLVRGNPGTNVCSRDCPAGQTASREGQCVPDALLPRRGVKDRVARDKGEPDAAVTGWETTATTTARTLPVPPLEGGRMALSGPPRDEPAPTPPGELAAVPPTAHTAARRKAREAASSRRAWRRDKEDWRRKVFQF
jgi:peptidoglycan hydrolase-like protein with peptidoglycan-binding domain